MTSLQFITALQAWVDGHPVSKRKHRGEYVAKTGSRLLIRNLMVDTVRGSVLAIRDPDRPLVLHSADFGVTDRWSKHSTVGLFLHACRGVEHRHWNEHTLRYDPIIAVRGVTLDTPRFLAPGCLLDLCSDGTPPTPHDVDHSTAAEWNRLQTVITHSVKFYPKGLSSSGNRTSSYVKTTSYFAGIILSHWDEELRWLNSLREQYNLPALPNWSTRDGIDLTDLNNLRQLAESA